MTNQLNDDAQRDERGAEQLIATTRCSHASRFAAAAVVLTTWFSAF